VNRFPFHIPVMLFAILVTASAPFIAQQGGSSSVHVSIVSANDPTDPVPLPPPDPTTPGFALHS